MIIYTKPAVDVFAPTDSGGNARSVVNGDAQAWGTEVETALNAALAGAGEIVGTWDASSGAFPGAGAADTGAAYLVTAAGTTGGVAFRVGDRIVSITTNSSTTTYAGNWLRLAGNLDPVVSATDSGAGTANAIQVVAARPVSADGGQIVRFNVYEANTSTAVTIQITDAVGAVISGLTIKTAAGNGPAVGALSAGLAVFGQIEGATFRLLSDLSGAAIQAAAEAAAATATIKAAEAAASAAAVAIQAFSSSATAEAATIAAGVNVIFVAGVPYERVTASYWNLGPEVLLNPEFTSSSNWSLSTGVTISGGKLLRDGNVTGGGAVSTGTAFVSSKAYLLQSVINSISGGQQSFNLQGGTLGLSYNTPGTKTEIQVCGSGFSGLAVYGAGGTVWEIESASAKRLPDSAFKSVDGAWWAPAKNTGQWALSQTALTNVPLETFTHTGFGGAFDSGRSHNALRSVGSGTHTGPYFTLSVERIADGSQTNGPGYADFAIWAHGSKSNYLTSTVEGEVGAIYSHLVQGRKGDASGLLVDVAKVRTGGGSETGAGTPIEVYSRIQNASGVDTLAIDTILAFTEATGGFSSGKGAGIATEARTGQVGIAFASVDRTDIAGASFEWVARAFEQRNSTTQYFEVTGTSNVAGKGVVRAYGNGNVTYPDFSFTRDTDTGIARGGADVLSFITGGASRMNISTSLIAATLPMSAATYFAISAAAGANREYRLQTNGVARFSSAISNEAESGANAGSNYLVTRYDDAGAYIDSPLSINRATGIVTLLNGASTNGSYKVSGNDVVKARKTGWSVATGTATRTAFDTATVTTAQLAERVKAMIDDLHATAGHGLIGA